MEEVLKLEQLSYANLRGTLAKYGKTQKDIATLLGCSDVNICRKMNHESDWNLKEMKAISKWLNESLDYLFSEE